MADDVTSGSGETVSPDLLKAIGDMIDRTADYHAEHERGMVFVDRKRFIAEIAKFAEAALRDADGWKAATRRLEARIAELVEEGAKSRARNAELEAALLRDRGDAERWRALLGCARLRLLGCAGFDPVKVLGMAEGTERFPNPPDYRHFGMEFWSHHDAGSDPAAARVLTDFADTVSSRPGEESPT